MTAGSVKLRARVGAGGSKEEGKEDGFPSTVTLADTSTITANGGKHGWLAGEPIGGAGYSGGSAGGMINNQRSSGGIGGTNGNDGGQGGRSGSTYAGGRGTGEDITSYELTHFNISPGRGGQRYKSKGNLNLKPRQPYYIGGGGGGVLVGGSGPAKDNHWLSGTQGEGYGGGHGSGSSRGLPGVILIEVVQAA